ncbi:MAG: hypothetical protein J2P48_18575, partial [Alphaproteobacteria bacterium]|nr:hypothetical protein [Alphaproteobacteria bacterium]
GSQTAREQVAPTPEFDRSILDSQSWIDVRVCSVISDWDRSPGLFLNRGATIPHPAAGAYVVDLQAERSQPRSLLSIARKVEPLIELPPRAALAVGNER